MITNLVVIPVAFEYLRGRDSMSECRNCRFDDSTADSHSINEKSDGGIGLTADRDLFQRRRSVAVWLWTICVIAALLIGANEQTADQSKILPSTAALSTLAVTIISVIASIIFQSGQFRTMHRQPCRWLPTFITLAIPSFWGLALNGYSPVLPLLVLGIAFFSANLVVKYKNASFFVSLRLLRTSRDCSASDPFDSSSEGSRSGAPFAAIGAMNPKPELQCDQHAVLNSESSVLRNQCHDANQDIDFDRTRATNTFREKFIPLAHENARIQKPLQIVSELVDEVRYVDGFDMPTVIETDEEHSGLNDRSMTQWMSRRGNSQGEVVEGWVRVEFEPGVREQVVHVSFCPPFSISPEMETEDLDGGGLEIRIVALFPFGARMTVRRSGNVKEAESQRVGFVATASSSRRAA